MGIIVGVWVIGQLRSPLPILHPYLIPVLRTPNGGLARA